MPRGNRSDVTTNVGVVREMWLAHNEGRLDDMIATMHPQVEWEPWSRPGLSLYTGHDGIRRMQADVLVANGAYTILLDDVTESESDVVTLKARLVRGEDAAEIPLEVQIQMRDGLIYRVSTLPS